MATPKKLPASAKDGDTISVEYEGKLEDGTTFDKGTLEFDIGSGDMIAGFDSGVVGMKEGETKTIKIKPKDGYGERDEELTMEIPMKEFMRNNIKPVKGAYV